MIKRIVLLLFVQFSIGQDLSSNWVNYDINSWRNMFSGYQSSELTTYAPDTWNSKRAKGIYSNQYFTIINSVYFLGPTPYQQHVLIGDNNNQKFSAGESYDSAERLLREMIKNIPSNEVKMISRVSLKRKSVGNPFTCYEFYDNNNNRTLIQICVIEVNDEYYVERVSYNKAGKYVKMFEEASPNNSKLTSALQAKLYYESSISPDKINSYNLKDYSEQFGLDLVAFHDSKIDLKTFGWFGDGYLQFKEINKKGVIGRANGMMENCIEKISIDPDEWQKASHYQRLWTVYHEIAHDIYNIKHGEAGPLMDAIMPPDINYLDFYLAKIELMEYIKSISPDDFECERNSIPIQEAKNYTNNKPKKLSEYQKLINSLSTKSKNKKVLSSDENSKSNSSKSIVIITGKVYDKKGVPLPGTIVKNQTSNIGASTDFDGNYSIKAKKGDVIRFRFGGKFSFSTVVGHDNEINVVLARGTSRLIK